MGRRLRQMSKLSRDSQLLMTALLREREGINVEDTLWMAFLPHPGGMSPQPDASPIA